MPSGHATVTFAAATVLQQHLGYKWAIPTYLVASYVALSRLHDNRHVASDVAAILACLAEDVAWDEWADNFAQRAGLPHLLPRRGSVEVADFFDVVLEPRPALGLAE